ncbi:MAG: DUF4249 domain-containing protein [Bacteroidota bacterium]
MNSIMRDIGKVLSQSIVFWSFMVVFIGGLGGCIDPVEPEFQFEEGLIFIDGFASTVPGASFVTVNTSDLLVGTYRLLFVEDAIVEFENIDTSTSVALLEKEGQYLPPDDFAVKPGETWRLNVSLPDGRNYSSAMETVVSSVPIGDLEAVYNPELEFREIQGGRFIPGHELLVSFDDPEGQENNYYYFYRTFEDLDICETCVDGYFRRGTCVGLNEPGPPYYNYVCDGDCWRIRYPESVSIFRDRFSDGVSVSKLPIANLPLHTNENMVVEVLQYSINGNAYEYFEVLKDLVDNSSGINAPPPAALVGNMFNVEDGDEFVLGRFTAAASSVARIFINRRAITEEVLEPRSALIFEEMFDPVPPPITTIAPCEESRFRTGIRPEGWIEQ